MPTSPPAGWRYTRDDSQGFGIYFDEASPANADRLADIDRKRRAAKSAARAEGRSARDAVETLAATVSELDRIARELRDATDDERAAIASALCLPAGVFAALGMRFRPPLHGTGGHRAAFAFPERDGAGRITGINLRHTDGSKLTYGPRGLFIPSIVDAADLADDRSPLICVEGASDTLALLAMNIAGVGRPNNTYGGELLGDWLTRAGLAIDASYDTKPIIILGENDAKIGGDWPGRDGAETFARTVADAIGRPVLVAFPPPAVKDVRDYLRRHLDDLRAGTLTLRDLGELLVEHATVTAYAMDGVGVIDVNSSPPVDPTGGDVIAAKVAELTAAGVQLKPGEIPPLGPTGATCDTPHRVFMRHVDRPRLGLFYFPCRRSTCAGCLPRKREHCRGTVQFHLREHAAPVYRSFVPAERWLAVYRRLRRLSADHFRIDDGRGAYLVVSTRPATDDDVLLTAEDAAARLSIVLGSIAFTDAKTFTTSRRWALLADPERQAPKWVRVSSISADQQTAADILDAHGADWRPFVNVGRWWETPGIVASENGIDIDRLALDLSAGTVLPPGGDWLGFNPGEV